MTLLDVNGIFDVPVMFCRCWDSNDTKEPESDELQCVGMRLYPASRKRPVAAFSFTLLEHFHKFTLASSLSLYDYVQGMEELTNCANPELVSVSLYIHLHEFRI